MTVTGTGLPDNANAVAAIHREAGFFHAPEYGLIEVTGSDAYSFLQSQLTNDIKSLVVGASQFTCLLDRKAHVESYFHLFKIADAHGPHAGVVKINLKSTQNRSSRGHHFVPYRSIQI